MQKFTATLAILTLAATAGAGAFAHHSASAYDLTRQVTVTGTVREFDWENPHVWLWLDVRNEKGTIDPYGIESSSPGSLRRAGLKWDSFVKGQQVTVSMWPWRNGQHGGGLANAVWPDGHNWHPTGTASPLPPGVAPTSQSTGASTTYKGNIP